MLEPLGNSIVVKVLDKLVDNVNQHPDIDPILNNNFSFEINELKCCIQELISELKQVCKAIIFVRIFIGNPFAF
ncbi:MAG: hypothetical protein AB7V56_04550 [Candidatus Nitrosocosmicus sp.]